MKKVMAIMLLAVVMSLGGANAFADGPTEIPGVTAAGPTEIPGITSGADEDTDTAAAFIFYLATIFSL
ncbi:MAG TPA: hypothetical protein VD966_00665 [Pyrinomonadaceae bacterium]|nr:hypothetical protein [Pyrinomonadaceae bacterium]